MRRRLAIGLIALVCAGCYVMAALNVERSGELGQPPKRFVPIFNGEDLDGWVIMGNPKAWQVPGGVIRSEGGKGGRWLRTEKEYEDFILSLEWRVSPGGNSGVFVRACEEGYPWATGHEIQISNEQPPRDDLHCTGALYGTVPVNPRPDETPNRWRRYEITCMGEKITVKVDAVTCVEADMDVVRAIKGKPLRGYIGLQDSHTGPDGVIEFRNILIKEL